MQIFSNGANVSTVLLLLGVVFLSILAACETSTNVIDTSCAAFKPITWSSRDTAETIQEVRQHNAAWESLCEVR